MLPLLALGVGLASGARAVGAAEAEKKQKEIDAQAEISAAFEKKLAEYKAKAVFQASPEGQFLTEQDLLKAQNETLYKERAKNVAEIEAARAERSRVQQVVRDRRMLLGRDLNRDVRTTFRDTEGVVDDDAVFLYRRINFDQDGNPRMLSPEEGGEPFMDVSVGQYKPRGSNGGEKITNALAEISGQQYNWWQANKPTLASLWKNQIGTLFEEAADFYSRSVDVDDARMPSSKIPRIPVSLANQIADAYGSEMAIELIEQVYDDARPGPDGSTVRENLAQTFSYAYGMTVNPVDVAPKIKVQVNDQTGEPEVTATINDKVIKIEENETVEESVIIENIGENIGYKDDTPHDRIVSAVNSMGKKLNKDNRTVMDQVVAVRQVFRQYTNYPAAPNASGISQPWKIFEQGTPDDKDGAQQAYAKYWNDNELFSGLSDEASITALVLIAPKNSVGVSTVSSRNPPKGRNALYPVYEDRSISAMTTEREEFEKYIETKYLAGSKREDIAEKGRAAKQAAQVAGALQTAYSDESAALSGTVGGAVSTFQGFLAQFDYIIKAIELSNDSDDKKQKLKNRITKARDQLSTDVNKGGLEEAAGATAIKGYYEGVLVYSMALALQGGNAAARTVSDADIERIQALLNFGKRLDDPKQKAAVMRVLKRAMTRQAVMADNYTSSNEAHVWAAYTADQTFIKAGQGRKDYLLSTLEMEVNRVTNGEFFQENPRAKPSEAVGTETETEYNGRKLKVDENGFVII